MGCPCAIAPSKCDSAFSRKCKAARPTGGLFARSTTKKAAVFCDALRCTVFLDGDGSALRSACARPSHGPNEGVADTPPEAKAAFRRGGVCYRREKPT